MKKVSRFWSVRPWNKQVFNVGQKWIPLRRHPVSLSKADITLLSEQPIHRVCDEYLSFSIDISVVAGGLWWEGSKSVFKGLGTIPVPPIELNSKKLDLWAKALSPAYLRVGGSEADKIHYFETAKEEEKQNCLLLTKNMWNNLHNFIQRNEFKFAFTIKYGLFKRSEHGSWVGSEVEKLLQYSQEKKYCIDVCELGNELNAYWAFHGLRSQPRAKHLAADYKAFQNLIKRYLPEAKIIGPGSAFWPKLGETIKPFSNLTRRFLETCHNNDTKIDIVDWHYYPFQSERAPIRTRTAKYNQLLKPRTLNEFKKFALKLKAMRDQFFPQAELWTGETGSAQCGGQPRFSDRFASCFWWADQLGLGASLGQQVMIRQSLIGGDYGMIDRLTLKARPDYWLTWIWKSLMGNQVFAVKSNHHLMRAYCHSSKNREGKTLMLINLSRRELAIECVAFEKIYEQYTITAKKLSSKKIYINGQRPKFKKGNFALTDFETSELKKVVPGYSINFWLIKN
ncbi:MAG: glycoside hydrolase [Pseudomonadota bacterium]